MKPARFNLLGWTAATAILATGLVALCLLGRAHGRDASPPCRDLVAQAMVPATSPTPAPLSPATKFRIAGDPGGHTYTLESLARARAALARDRAARSTPRSQVSSLKSSSSRRPRR